MKLQAQYTRVTIISTLFILIIASTGFYQLLRHVLVNELDKALKVEEVEIYDYIKNNHALPMPTKFKDQRISYKETPFIEKRRFTNLSFTQLSGEPEAARELLFPVTIDGKHYVVSVIQSAEDTRDLLLIILLITLGLILLLLITLMLINRFLLKKLWHPFIKTLSSIKEFNISAPSAMHIEKSKIKEFNELNENVRLMAEKVTKDYQSLKSFTDHASHEMQTPLAIINSKLDVLIQQPELREKSMEYVEEIYKSVDKLSRLCQSLLLLTRIENNQYNSPDRIFISDIISEKCREFDELLRGMDFRVDMQLQPLEVTMDKELADILINNLFINAVRHSKPGASLILQTNNHELIIANSGQVSLDKSKIFARFYKAVNSSGSGLGLATARQICEQYSFNITYDFTNGLHYFRIKF